MLFRSTAAGGAWNASIVAELATFGSTTLKADGLGAYLPLASRIEGAEEYLPLGTDTIWAYYTRNGAFMTFEVICCPSRLHPDIPCPLPPS